MSDLRQSMQYSNYLKSIEWKIETCLPAGRKSTPVNIYCKYLFPIGWFVKIQHPSVLTDKIINFVESTYHPFQFSIEPLENKQVNLLNKYNFKINKFPSLPSKTLIIYLNKSQDYLLKSFSQKTRYNIKLSKTKNIKIVESKNILDFTDFWRENFEKKRFFYLPAGMAFFSQQKNIIALSNAFGKNSHILLAKKDNEIIASLFLLVNDKVMYYMYAASNDTGRNNFAPTLLTWNAILLAKKLKCHTFDFDGIYDERFPINSWLGFTKFKLGFTKTEINYPGRFVKTKSFFSIT
ncbi:hypothetical protein BH10PAT1_BH10PAT1_2050 [soil metagenome]